MKTIFGVLIGLVLSLPLFAQQVQQVPLIEVEGYAERKVNPDEAVFQIALQEKAMKVSEATNILNKKTQILADALKKAKIRDFKLVADNFSVNVNTVYRGGTSRDSGYVARQMLQIITSPTNDDLQKIVEAIQSAGDMSYELAFRISEETRKSLENTLLTEALKDAEARATLIGNTLALRGLRVFHVSMEQNFRPVGFQMAMAKSASESADMMIQPDDQTLSKRVYVKYTY